MIRLALEQVLELGFNLVFQFQYGKLDRTKYGSVVDYVVGGMLVL